MGCCLSTQNQSNPKTKTKPQISPPSNHHHNHAVSKSPPRAEEEAVKEVLSETPKPLIEPISVPIPNPNPYYYTPIPKINHSPTTTNAIKHHPPSLHLPPPLSPPSPVTADQNSELSEISCLSESVSSEVHQRVPVLSNSGQIHKPTSFSNDQAVRRERITGKSPVRRQNPSPVRNRVGEGQRRREFGENSGRRSRSPVTRNESVVSRSNTGRSPSARKAGISPGRVRMVQPGSGKEEERDVGWDDPTAPTESLENPLVSLECFIFL